MNRIGISALPYYPPAFLQQVGLTRMHVVMERSAGPEDVALIVRIANEMGLEAHAVHRRHYAVIEIAGSYDPSDMAALQRCPGVAEVRAPRPYKLVSRYHKPDDTVVDVGGIPIGGDGVVVAAGPHAVESYEQTRAVAELVAGNGGQLLQGGTFLENTSPYAFRGQGEEALKILARAGKELGLPVVADAVDQQSLDLAARYADAVRIGAGHMQNFALLRAASRTRKPVLLERGASALVEELLLSAEYLMMGGNERLILCERGIRTYSDHDPAVLDLSMVPAVKRLSHLPVLVDASQSSAKREKVLPLARAAIAGGADGVLVTLHHESQKNDVAQALLPETFAQLMRETGAIARTIGRFPVPAAAPTPAPRKRAAARPRRKPRS